jgi:glycine cleavage system aminomethyltransferase T
MRAIDRLQLVGVRPVNRLQRLRNGTHLVDFSARSKSLGYITSSTPSVELEGWVGLALLTAGRSRIGERLLCVAPVHDLSMPVEIVSPHLLDPAIEGLFLSRFRASSPQSPGG